MNKVKGSWASYMPKPGQDGETNLSELANLLLNWGDIPKSINDTKAYELMLLAKDYLRLKRQPHKREEAE